MRSRYAACTLADMDYIEVTMKDKALEEFDKALAKQWAAFAQWIGLNIVAVENQREDKGFVEFIAYYKEKNILKSIHEISEFQRIENEWFYIDGIQLSDKKNHINRNSKCPCGSQRKYKNCHDRYAPARG